MRTLVFEPAPARMLAVAPHPDDETLGCGGLIASLARCGTQVHVLFVTDGGASHPGSRIWDRPRLAALRAAEAEAALGRLGAGGHGRTFLRLADAAMPAPGTPGWTEALARVKALLSQFAPDLVVLPWRRDPHCDHRASFDLVQAAITATDSRPATLEYAVWLDELGAPEDFPSAGEAEAVAVDIASCLDEKRAAIDTHASQLGRIVTDDPSGFVLSEATLARLVTPTERYFQPTCGQCR